MQVGDEHPAVLDQHRPLNGAVGRQRLRPHDRFDVSVEDLDHRVPQLSQLSPPSATRCEISVKFLSLVVLK